jgi:type II secretion system protein N
MAVDWTTWKPRLLYGTFFVLAFLLALRQTLPAADFKERLVQEAGQRGWKLEAARAGPAGLIGLRLEELRLKDRSGLVMPVDSLEVSLRPLALLVGKVRLGLVIRLWDGVLRGTVDVTGQPQVAELALEHLDLAQATPLRLAAGLDLAGLASGTARFTLPADEKGKLEGRAELAVAGAGLAGGKLPVPGMGGDLTVPKVSLGQVSAQLVVGEGKATFEKLSSAGGDAILNADGLYLMLQPRAEFAPLFGKASLKVEEAFAARPENRALKALLDASLASSRGRDGAYQLQVFGTLGHPQARPQPATP